MQLVSDEAEDVAEHPHGPQRWRWRMDVRPLVTLPMEAAPSLADIGVDPLRVRRQSHILLNDSEFESARALIVEAARGRAHVESSSAAPVDTVPTNGEWTQA
jgi:hypothetical protein